MCYLVKSCYNTKYHMKKTWSTWTDSRKPFLPLINNNGKNYGTILRHSKKFMEKYGTHGTFLGNYLPLVNNISGAVLIHYYRTYVHKKIHKYVPCYQTAINRKQYPYPYHYYHEYSKLRTSYFNTNEAGGRKDSCSVSWKENAE